MPRDYEPTGYHDPLDPPPFTFPPPMKPRQPQRTSWLPWLFTAVSIALGVMAGLVMRSFLNSL